MWATAVVLSMQRHTVMLEWRLRNVWGQEKLLWVREHWYDLWLPEETSDYLRLDSESMHPSLFWRCLRLCTTWWQEDWWCCRLQLCCGATTEVRFEHCCLRTWVSHNCPEKPEAILWAVFVIVCSVGGPARWQGGLLPRIFFVWESMERPRNVNDWVETRREFSQFMVKPSHFRRFSVNWGFTFDSPMEEPRIRKSSS